MLAKMMSKMEMINFIGYTSKVFPNASKVKSGLRSVMLSNSHELTIAAITAGITKRNKTSLSAFGQTKTT